MDLMSDMMTKRGFDAKKLPLGKLSKSTIRDGYEVLAKIEAVLDNTVEDDLMDLSSSFYTLIPHNFGYQNLAQFIIDTEDKLKERLETLEYLGDLEVANKLMSKGVSEVDGNYAKLNVDISPVEKKTEEYKLIYEYFMNTRDQNNFVLEELYKVKRKGEDKTFKKDVGNEYLLWHGTPMTNIVSILSKGLKVKSTDFPWLSDRIFHADMLGKSIFFSNYQASKNIALVLLNRVALGQNIAYCETGVNVWSPMSPDSTSIVLVGSHAPPKSSHIIHDNITIPLGKPNDSELVKV
jgi:poly [ADP-ribose] polymerase